MGLTTTELGDKSKDGSCILGFTGQSAKCHAGMLTKGSCEAGSREKQFWLPVVFGGRPSNNLFKGNSKFIWIERPTLSYFLSRYCNFVPEFHRISLRSSFENMMWQATPNFRANTIGQQEGPFGIAHSDFRT